MANYNLTNQAIEDSFQPLLQIDSGSALRDGSGSLVDNIIVTSSYALTASFAENAGGGDTGSLLTTASFDNGTRDLTFTKGDSSTFSVNIPDASGSVLPSGVISGSSQVDYPQISNIPSGIVSSSAQVSDLTASLLETASVVDATITFTKGDGTTFDITVDNVLNSTYAQNTITTGKNMESFPIFKGTPLYFSGSGTQGNIVGVYLADAGNPSRMPAGGIAGQNINAGEEGVILLDGYIGGVNTTLFNSGDEVFVGVGGGYTNVPPTGSTNLIQHLGNVEKSAVNGSGVIQMMGEARGLPNIQQGYAWVGDGNGVPQAVATSSFVVSIDTGSFATTGSNTFNGNQSINGILGVTMENEFDESFIGVSGSAGKTPRVNYEFTEYSPGDWDYRQTFTDIDFAYFRNDGGGMLFTAPNNDIKFVSPTTNIWSRNLIIKDEIGGLPTNVILTGSLNMSGNQLVNGLFGLVGNPNTTFDMYSDGGNFDTFKVQVLQNNGTRITDWDGSSDQTWLTIPTNTGSNPSPIFNRGLDITGSLGISGNTNQQGFVTQNFTAPATEAEIAFMNVSGAVVQGRNYNRTFFGMADYPGFGKQFEDYFAIEYYDGFGYNFGSEFAINGSGTTIQTAPSGSGFAGRASITTVDNYDGTADININARNGKINIVSALSLNAQDPLPSGAVGDLAVSGSNLYFYDGVWKQVSLV